MPPTEKGKRMDSEFFYKSALELEKLLDSGELASVELTKAVIERTKSIDDKLNALISFDEEKQSTERFNLMWAGKHVKN
jgi:Asp-tRNA(Asn)/Glu-tRNA(Gln) amidotransferase A subunit family amidase